MRIKNNKFRFGFIDPISIFTGLFLVATLIVSAAVVKNKNFSFNINEKASCMTTCMNQVGDQAECNFTCKESTKVTDKVTAPAPKPKAETTKLCGYCKDTGTCVSCTNGGENVGECSTSNDCNKGSVNLPPAATQQPLTTTPIDNSLEKEEIQNIQQVITAPVVINGTVINPATSVPVEEPAETADVNPVVTVTSPVVKTCSANGAQYPADSVVVYAGQGSYRKCVDGSWVNNCGSNGANEPCEITDLTPNFVPTYLGGQYQAAIDALQASLYPSEDYVAGPSQNSSAASTNNTTSTISTSSTCNNSCPSTQKCVLIGMGYYGCQNISGTNSITTYTKADINCSNKCATNQKCVASTTSEGNVCETVAYVPYEPKKPVVTTSVQDLIASLTDRFNSVSQNTGMTNIGTTSLGGGNSPVVTNQFADNTQVETTRTRTNCYLPVLTQEERDACTNIARVATYNSPLFNSYIHAYAPENVTYNYEVLGYDSLNECLNDPKNMGRGQSKCSGYQVTTEQVVSSVRLGTTLTAAGGVIAASGGTALGYMTLPEMVAAGMAASTVYQTGSATATCIDNPRSKECINEASWAAVSWANIGTSAWANTLSTGTAETVNAVVNVLNIGADAVDISQSCYGENKSSFGCTAAWAGTVFDVGQGVGDISRAVNNSLGGLDLNVNTLGNTTTVYPSNLTSVDLQASAIDVNSSAGNDLVNIQSPPNVNNTALALDGNSIPTNNGANTEAALLDIIIEDAKPVVPTVENGPIANIGDWWDDNSPFKKRSDISINDAKPEAPTNQDFIVTKPENQATIEKTLRYENFLVLNKKTNNETVNYFEKYLDDVAEQIAKGEYKKASEMLTNETFQDRIGVYSTTETSIINQRTADDFIDKSITPALRNILADKFNGRGPGRVQFADFIDGETRLEINFPDHIQKEISILQTEEFFHQLQKMKAEDLGIPDHYKDPSFKFTEEEVALFLNNAGVPLDETFMKNYTRTELGLPEYSFNPIQTTTPNTSVGLLPKIKNWWDESILNWQNWGGGSPAGDLTVDSNSLDLETTVSNDDAWQNIRRTETDILNDSLPIKGRVVDLPQSNPETGLSTAIIYRSPQEGRVTIYRGIGDPETIFDQTASLLRDDPENIDLRIAVKNFADSPSPETFDAVKKLITDPEGIADMNIVESTLNRYLEMGLDYEHALARVHISSSQGPVDPGRISPYLSASTSIDESSGYSFGRGGGIIVASVPENKIIRFDKYFRETTEIAIKADLDSDEIVAFIPISKGTDTNPKAHPDFIKELTEANQYVDRRVQVIAKAKTDITPNSFVTTSIDGKTPKRVTDLLPTDITPEYQSWLKKLEYNVKQTDLENGSRVESFVGYEYKRKPNSSDDTVEIVPVITGESIGSGASRNALLVTDHVNNKSWVMYGPTNYGPNTDAVGSISMVQSIDDSLTIPIKGLYSGANRYLPLVNEVTLFPKLPDTAVVNKAINAVNTMVSVVYPAGIADVYKFFYLENLKVSGLFNNEELHGGNIAYAVWDNKPQSGFVMPIPNFKWAIIGNVKIPLPGISWVTLETVEASYR